MLIHEKQWQELTDVLYKILEGENTETAICFKLYLSQYMALQDLYPDGRLKNETDEKKNASLHERLDKAGIYLSLASVQNKEDVFLQLFYLLHWLCEEGEHIPYAAINDRVAHILYRVIHYIMNIPAMNLKTATL